MKPVLFFLPKFSSSMLGGLILLIVIISILIYLIFRKKVPSPKKILNSIITYSIAGIILLFLIYKFAPIPIRTYGVAVASGFLFAIYAAVRLAKKDGIKSEYIIDIGVWALVGTVIGARLFYFIFYDFEYLAQNPLKFFAVWEGGMVFYGGLIGAIIAGYIYVNKKKLNVLKISDIIGVALPLGIFFGRWGCFGYGCCFGKPAPSWFPFAIRFPAKHYYGLTPAFEDQLLHGLVKNSDKFTLPVYPTQLISSINGLLLFLILYWLYKHKKFDGQIASLSIIFYAITRSLIEFMRVNPEFLGLTVSQWVGVFMAAFGLWLYKYSRKNLKNDAK